MTTRRTIREMTMIPVRIIFLCCACRSRSRFWRALLRASRSFAALSSPVIWSAGCFARRTDACSPPVSCAADFFVLRTAACSPSAGRFFFFFGASALSRFLSSAIIKFLPDINFFLIERCHSHSAVVPRSCRTMRLCTYMCLCEQALTAQYAPSPHRSQECVKTLISYFITNFAFEKGLS